MKDLYKIHDHLNSDKEIQTKMYGIIEANYNKIQEKELIRSGVWFRDKLGTLQKPKRYLPFEEKYINS